jgi:DNA (cytosine-5)-methyltransferase 1
MGRQDYETETMIVTHALRAEGFDASEDGTGRGTPLVPIGFYGNDSGNDAGVNLAPTLRAMPGGGGNHPAMAMGMAVRRLTPRECERLQGFPDGYTKISDKTADGPRYKALGNSFAVPVVRWIGERIQMVEGIA